MREVICGDALDWLNRQDTLTGCSLVASLPDISEFQSFTLVQWQEWFIQTARLVLSRCPDDGVVVFYQSDVKHDGQWVAKDFLCQLAARAEGFHLVWHKIVCRAVPGSTSFGRPLYSHMLCFSRGIRADISKASVDVLPDVGEKTWERGMGLEACMTVAKFIAEQTTTRKVVHPFCGEGSMLACANHVGLQALGIERSPKRSEKARALQLHANGKQWAWPERITMFELIVPPFSKMLQNLSLVLEKGALFAESKKIDVAVLLNARLAPDQFNLIRQVQIACDTAKLGAARLAGKEAPVHEDKETTLPELQARIASVRAYLETFTEKDFVGAEERRITQPRWEGKWLTGKDFAHHHAIPNIYFHVTTAYAILRHNGVEVGKKDYLGPMPYRT